MCMWACYPGRLRLKYSEKKLFFCSQKKKKEEKKKAEYEAGHGGKKGKADNKSNLTVEMFSSMWRREKKTCA